MRSGSFRVPCIGLIRRAAGQVTLQRANCILRSEDTVFDSSRYIGLRTAIEVHRRPLGICCVPSFRGAPGTRRERRAALPRRRNAVEFRRLPLEQPAIDSPGPGGERGMGALLDDLAAIE